VVGRGVSFASIVHVNEKGGSFGGTEEYIALVTAELASRGVSSHLVCGAVSGVLPGGLASLHIVEGLASRVSRPDCREELVRVIEQLDADVIMLHNVFDPTLAAAVAEVEGRGTLIWYVHDHYLTCLSELRWRRDVGSCPQRLGHDCLVAIDDGHCVLRFPDHAYGVADLERRMALSDSLGAADAVIVVSEYMRALLCDAQPGLEARLHLLRRPIRHLDTSGRRHRTSRHDPAVVTFAGRITQEKGLAVVIEALGNVACDAPVELRIAGVVEDDGYWMHCQRLQTAAMRRNRHLTVAHLGHLGYGAIDQQLAQSDIVTVPSLWPEPLGAIALEAMAAGAAVIASKVGGLSDLVVQERNGLHADPGNVNAWTEALTALLRHPRRATRLGRQAQRECTSVTIDHHLADLDNLVATPSQP
jgi:glycosyltransferase involved in cell wall biosynthesis